MMLLYDFTNFIWYWNFHKLRRPVKSCLNKNNMLITNEFMIVLFTKSRSIWEVLFKYFNLLSMVLVKEFTVLENKLLCIDLNNPNFIWLAVSLRTNPQSIKYIFVLFNNENLLVSYNEELSMLTLLSPANVNIHRPVADPKH